MDFKVNNTFQSGERIRIMEALTACLTLAEARYNHFTFESDQYGMQICCYFSDLKTLKSLDNMLKNFLDPKWKRSLGNYVTKGRKFYTLEYRYIFAESEL